MNLLQGTYWCFENRALKNKNRHANIIVESWEIAGKTNCFKVLIWIFRNKLSIFLLCNIHIHLCLRSTCTTGYLFHLTAFGILESCFLYWLKIDRFSKMNIFLITVSKCLCAQLNDIQNFNLWKLVYWKNYPFQYKE